MLKAVLGLAAILGKLMEFFEQNYARKRQAETAKTQAKAENYDKLQRALKARRRARGLNSASELPDDKYRRDE